VKRVVKQAKPAFSYRIKDNETCETGRFAKSEILRNDRLISRNNETGFAPSLAKSETKRVSLETLVVHSMLQFELWLLDIDVSYGNNVDVIIRLYWFSTFLASLLLAFSIAIRYSTASIYLKLPYSILCLFYFPVPGDVLMMHIVSYNLLWNGPNISIPQHNNFFMNENTPYVKKK
jgi:hypothetical protein